MKRHGTSAVFLAVCVFACVAAVPAPQANGDAESIPVGKFRLEVGKDLASTDNTLVLRMALSISPSAHELGTRMTFRYMDKLSHDGWAGQLHTKLKHDLLFVAQFMGKSSALDTPILMYTFQHGGASAAGLQEAPGKNGLDEIIRLTAESGIYDLGTPLIIGELAGKPITLSVGPPRKE